MDFNRSLEKLVREHDVDVAIRDGWISTGLDGSALRAFLYPEPDEHGAKVSLVVEVALPDGRLLIETFTSVAGDEGSATKSVMGKLAFSCLHPILCGLFGAPVDGQVTRQRWPIDGDDWDVYMGNVFIEPFQSYACQDRLTRHVRVPEKLFDELGKLVRSQKTRNRDVHWTKVFLAHVGNDVDACEAHWDGMVWPGAEERLANLPWAASENYYTVRSFLLLKRAGSTEAPHPRRDYRWVLAGAEQLLGTMVSDPDATDDELCDRLVARGVDRCLAGRLVTFLPIAFCKTLFENLPLPDVFATAHTPDQVSRFDQEPGFLAGREIAFRLLRDSDDRFRCVVARCAMFNAINQALSAGRSVESLRDASFPPPVVWFAKEDV